MDKTRILNLHRKLKGKLEIKSKLNLNKNLLSLVYTPGVAEVSKEVLCRKKALYDYTIKGNSVAIVTDGSSVLGLGNIGAEAALPVMEGKAILFKEFANIDAFPICVKSQNVEDIISVVKNISPVFGGVNLEDIQAPKCFEIENKLQNIGIPVIHDDQHCTAIVVLAALLNACKVTGKDFEELRIVVSGAGAAGTAITKFLVCYGYKSKLCKSVKDIIILDRKGAIYRGRDNLADYKKELARITNKNNKKGNLKECIKGADVFIGVSAGNILNESMIKEMAEDSIVFALANPTPEIMPGKAKKAGAEIVATGRSDFPNQVNNALAFPGVFRGLLNTRAKKLSAKMKLHAAYALASTLSKPKKDMILPSIFDKNIVKNISRVIEESV